MRGRQPHKAFKTSEPFELKISDTQVDTKVLKFLPTLILKNNFCLAHLAHLHLRLPHKPTQEQSQNSQISTLKNNKITIDTWHKPIFLR
jgi:hypothetical protein